MPKGVPKAGYRKTKPRIVLDLPKFESINQSHMSEQEISAKIQARFRVLASMVSQTIRGNCRTLIISGPPGLGKSHLVETMMRKWDKDGKNYTIIKGFSRATGLYKQLYQHRSPGQILVLDDADSIYGDDVCLNLLKAACDTGKQRWISWLSERFLTDDNDERIPNQFEFRGSVIFLTNINYDSAIRASKKLAPHLQALRDRAHYVDLAIRTKRDYLIRIKQVLNSGMLREKKLSPQQANEVFSWVVLHADRVDSLSLRTVLKVAEHRKRYPNTWRDYAEVTCCDNK